MTLKRNGEQDVASSVIPIDDLVYSYDDGNKLMIVKDLEHISAGYDDIHTTTGQDDFDYDTYGNLILNKDKDIIAIDYNHLNLPTEITFGNGGTIEYLYDAVGIKLKKTVTDGTNIDVTEYIDGFQYTGNQTNVNLDFFPTAEGYVKVLINDLGGTVYNYVFQYMDHLGNIRMKYGEDPQNNYALTILEEDHYYPYGLAHKGYNGNHRVFDITGVNIILTPVNSFLGDTYTYGFGGKEQQEEFGIAMYDFGARNYDSALGRWMNIDPLAEAIRRHSPYNYAFNNPNYFIDADGMMPGGFANLDRDTSTGSFSTTGGFNVSSLDKEGNIVDNQYHTNSGDAEKAAAGIEESIVDQEVDSAYGDKADDPAPINDKTVQDVKEKVPTLSNQVGSFKTENKITISTEFVGPGKNDDARTHGDVTDPNSPTRTTLYRVSFNSYRILAKTLFHEFYHVIDFQYGVIYRDYLSICGGNCSEDVSRQGAEQLGEVRAYRAGLNVAGVPYSSNAAYKIAIKYLNSHGINY